MTSPVDVTRVRVFAGGYLRSLFPSRAPARGRDRLREAASAISCDRSPSCSVRHRTTGPAAHYPGTSSHRSAEAFHQPAPYALALRARPHHVHPTWKKNSLKNKKKIHRSPRPPPPATRLLSTRKHSRLLNTRQRDADNDYEITSPPTIAYLREIAADATRNRATPYATRNKGGVS